MTYLSKETILKQLLKTNLTTDKNSTGTVEKYYEPFYSLHEFFEEQDINPETLSETELNNLLRLAEFLSEAFFWSRYEKSVKRNEERK